MVGTFYSICIANRENFVYKSSANVISQLEHLTPKHKVMILAPSFNFMWYERNSATAVAVINHFIHNFSEYLELNEEYGNCWNVIRWPMALTTLCAKDT